MTNTVSSDVWILYIYFFGQMLGDSICDAVVLNSCGLDRSRYEFMGLMCCPCVDLTPQTIFSRSAYLYIHSSSLINIIIFVAVVLVTFYMEKFQDSGLALINLCRVEDK